MSNKTIAKFAALVILVLGANALLGSCSHPPSTRRGNLNSNQFSSEYEKPEKVGQIESAGVTESSGLAASLCQPDVLWTHNDSGADAFIFAMTSTGKNLGKWRVTNARNTDWEDLATMKAADGTCYLYIGEIGNNKLARSEFKIYRVKEPSLSNSDADSGKKDPLQTEPAEAVTFAYPDAPHDAETLMIHPTIGDFYVLTKRLDGPSLIFKIVPQFGSEQVIAAKKVGELSVPAVPNGFLTGGAISPDGKRVIVCDYSAGYELTIGNALAFDEIWRSTPVPIDLGDRKQGEAVTFGPDGRVIFATSEGKNAGVFEIKIK